MACLCSADTALHEGVPTLQSHTAYVLVWRSFDMVAIYFPSEEKHAVGVQDSLPSPSSEATSCHDSVSQVFIEPSIETDNRDLPSGENETSRTPSACPRKMSAEPLSMSQTTTYPECPFEVPSPSTVSTPAALAFNARKLVWRLWRAAARYLLPGLNEIAQM